MLALAAGARLAFVPAPPAQARRAVLGATAVGAMLAAGAGGAGAIEPCRDGANNCFSTVNKGKLQVPSWKWPAGASQADAVASLRQVLEGYPQAGQNDVDKGGWKLAVDELSTNGYARVEYMSGIGNFARFFNGGKPFVDDLEVKFNDGVVQVKSSSRLGDSDFGVNAKRLNYIADALRAKGWDAQGVKA